MSTLLKARDFFTQAQAVALKEDNDFNELIAIGLQELASALDLELRQIQQRQDETNRLIRQQS